MINPLLAKYASKSVYELFQDAEFSSLLLKMGYTQEFFVPESKKLSVNLVIRRNISLSTRQFIREKEVQKLLFLAGWRIAP